MKFNQGWFSCLCIAGKSTFFCLLVKRTLKPLTPGEVAAIADGEGILPRGRTQFIPIVLLAPHPVGETYSLPQFALSHARRGDLWSPAVTQSRKKERRNLSPLFFVMVVLFSD